MLQLVGEGRISLEDTVERWLPGAVAGDGPDGSSVTVRQLLQHTSGIPEVLPEIAALNSADGYRAERFRTYTPMIVREVTGRSWDREVEDRIIRPLGLSGTSTPGTSPLIPGPHARAYAAFGTGTGGGSGSGSSSSSSIDVMVLNNTRDGSRTAVVYATSDGGPDTQQAMRTLVDRELCGDATHGK
ncbi:serine hydrolase domain-containing protein [Streptomyces sp. BE230]|uniref:serine hydrolase domain-containing protein n=1 Tax=Streptomyces sp. BE230 TaxID=3002526 RepID=UPI002ED6945D|nr:serine hydrolase domain-containing protein [Streptomyces sp. BE230]